MRRSAGRGLAQDGPGATPDREDDGRGGEPQPGDAERVDVDEEQDREGRAEVVERRAEQDGAERGGRDAAPVLREGRVVTGSETVLDTTPSSEADRPI